MRLRLSSAANADISEIALGLRAESRQAALKFVSAVDRGLKQISAFPESGTPRPDLAEGWRMISLRPFAHLLFYATKAGDIVVIRVIDGRRDLKAALRDL